MVYGPQQVAALVAPDHGIINAKRARWTQRWNRAVEKVSHLAPPGPPPRDTMAFLRLDALVKRYGDYRRGRCNLSVGRANSSACSGALGCGKTTTLQMVASFTPADAGARIVLSRPGHHWRQTERARPGHRVPELCAVPHMTVADNVAFGLEMRRVPVDERRRQVGFQTLGWWPGALRDPLSAGALGGQRSACAGADPGDQPPVLLLDEPMGALDAKLREDMQIELRALQRTVGITTLMVTHDQAEAMTLADRVVLMNKGPHPSNWATVRMYEQPWPLRRRPSRQDQRVRPKGQGAVVRPWRRGTAPALADGCAKRSGRLHRSARETAVRPTAPRCCAS